MTTKSKAQPISKVQPAKLGKLSQAVHGLVETARANRPKPPYENARRAGKTNPDKIEMLNDKDPRSRLYRKSDANNRTNRRRNGIYIRVNPKTQERLAPRPERRAEARRAAKAASRG